MTPKAAAKIAEKQEKEIIKRLREARLAKGLTYEALAEITGIHRTTISMIERSKIHPTMLVCLKLAVVLGLDLTND